MTRKMQAVKGVVATLRERGLKGLLSAAAQLRNHQKQAGHIRLGFDRSGQQWQLVVPTGSASECAGQVLAALNLWSQASAGNFNPAVDDIPAPLVENARQWAFAAAIERVNNQLGSLAKLRLLKASRSGNDLLWDRFDNEVRREARLAMYEWTVRIRSYGVPLSDEGIRDQALLMESFYQEQREDGMLIGTGHDPIEKLARQAAEASQPLEPAAAETTEAARDPAAVADDSAEAETLVTVPTSPAEPEADDERTLAEVAAQMHAAEVAARQKPKKSKAGLTLPAPNKKQFDDAAVFAKQVTEWEQYDQNRRHFTCERTFPLEGGGEITQQELIADAIQAGLEGANDLPEMIERAFSRGPAEIVSLSPRGNGAQLMKLAKNDEGRQALQAAIAALVDASKPLPDRVQAFYDAIPDVERKEKGVVVTDKEGNAKMVKALPADAALAVASYLLRGTGEDLPLYSNAMFNKILSATGYETMPAGVPVGERMRHYLDFAAVYRKEMEARGVPFASLADVFPSLYWLTDGEKWMLDPAWCKTPPVKDYAAFKTWFERDKKPGAAKAEAQRDRAQNTAAPVAAQAA